MNMSTSSLNDSGADIGVSPVPNRKTPAKGRGSAGKSSKKKEKLYCVCQTPYDDSR